MPIRGKEILKKQYPLAYDLVILKKKKKRGKQNKVRWYFFAPRDASLANLMVYCDVVAAI